jgi:hypothetical protein
MDSKISAIIIILIAIASSTIFVLAPLIHGQTYFGIFFSSGVVGFLIMITSLTLLSLIATTFFFYGDKKLKGSWLAKKYTRKERVSIGIGVILFLWSLPVAVGWPFLPFWPWFGELNKIQQHVHGGNITYSILLLVIVLFHFVFSIIIDYFILCIFVAFIMRTFMSKEEATVYFQKIIGQRSGFKDADFIAKKSEPVLSKFYFWLLERIWR